MMKTMRTSRRTTRWKSEGVISSARLVCATVIDDSALASIGKCEEKSYSFAFESPTVARM